MAKKTRSSSSSRGKSAGQSRGGAADRTDGKLESLAKSVVSMASRAQDPEVLIPTRALSNVAFNEKTRHVELGDGKQSRSLFNYGQAKRFMQTLLVASKCKELISRDKTASIRQIYYLSKHTIKGTSEKTFDDAT